MKRIIHVGNFSWKPKGAFQHGVALKLSNGLVRNGHHVINFSDRDVARTAGLTGHRKFGVGRANKLLHQLCRDVEPDAVFFGHADVIRPDTIRQIREDLPGVRILQWNVDPIFEEDNVRRIESKLEIVDATFVSTAGEALRRLVRPGKMVGFLPNPTDCSIERSQNYSRADLSVDLLYAVGNPRGPRHHCGASCDVEQLMRYILRAVPDLKPGFYGMFGESHVTGGAYQRVLESARIGLNLSRRNDYYLYSSDRLAHMAGNGLLVFIDRATGYGELFAEDELVFYSSVDELIDKIRFFKANDAERRRIAERGAVRYHALFNERIIAEYIVAALFGDFDPARYPWPTLL